MEQIQAHNVTLQQHAAHLKQQKTLLRTQLEDMEDKFAKVNSSNKKLSVEIQALRKSLQVSNNRPPENYMKFHNPVLPSCEQ